MCRLYADAQRSDGLSVLDFPTVCKVDYHASCAATIFLTIERFIEVGDAVP
jgi:hypothetical protein